MMSNPYAKRDVRIQKIQVGLFMRPIIPGVLRLHILPSPSADVVLTRYEEAAFPTFSQLFEPPSASSPLRHLARDREEAPSAIVLENRSEKAITGLRCRWRMTDESGQHRTNTVSSDSYMVDVYRAVAEPGSRHLITPSGSLDETLIDHVRSGGGLMGASVSRPSLAQIVEVSFEIDFILFADGEIAGPDTDRYAADLRSRKPAAEFVAKQVRLAMAEGRDVTPVLSALAEVPCLGRLGHAQGDPLVHWTGRYAREYLRAMGRKIGTVDMREARLRHFENRPEIPKFYRRPQ